MNSQSIPVIDIARLEDPETLQQLDLACRDWGFFQVVQHGIDAETISALSHAMRTFFSQPTTAKRLVSRTAENPWGFFDHELTKNVRDWKEIYDYGPSNGAEIKPQWPAQIPDFEVALRAFYSECHRLARRLLGAISANLGMPKYYLACNFGTDHTSFLRLNYYPTCPAAAAANSAGSPGASCLGINEHTDAGALTLLLQDDQPGLEVFRNGQWHLVEPRSDALVINVGDILQVWSNDRYRASLHRVIANSKFERYSAPFFFNPSYRTNFEPLATTVNEACRPRYRSINWGDFRARRAAGDFADNGEEIQISHYRT